MRLRGWRRLGELRAMVEQEIDGSAVLAAAAGWSGLSTVSAIVDRDSVRPMLREHVYPRWPWSWPVAWFALRLLSW